MERLSKVEALLADKDTSVAESPEDSEAHRKQVSSWKVLKPYIEANHPEFLRTLPGQFGWYIDPALNSTNEKTELCWAGKAASVLDFIMEHSKGSRDIKGRPVKGGPRLASGKFLPQMLGSSMKTFYGAKIFYPPIGTAALPHISEPAQQR